MIFPFDSRHRVLETMGNVQAKPLFHWILPRRQKIRLLKQNKKRLTAWEGRTIYYTFTQSRGMKKSGFPLKNSRKFAEIGNWEDVSN